jgi:hypothetical protein
LFRPMDKEDQRQPPSCNHDFVNDRNALTTCD